MKAVRIHHTGGPDVLVVEDVETPKPPPGTVLVKVGVSGVNYTDVMARQGIYMSRESGRDLPRTMGTEVAGVVTAVGEGVEPDLVGSRVVAFVEGGYAEYAVADRRLTFRLPESVELGDAVASWSRASRPGSCWSTAPGSARGKRCWCTPRRAGSAAWPCSWRITWARAG